MATDTESGKAPITIKKYANRRLYNTATSSYVTLDHLSQMVKDGIDFVVYDAKSSDDITRAVLTHIIVEEESKGQNLLPIGFLRHLISFYGDSLQALVPRYLEYSMQSFARNQVQMRQYMRDTLDGLMPFNKFEEMGKQNMAFFESAMKVFTPFYGEDGGGTGSGSGSGMPGGALPSDPGLANRQLEEMRVRINEMQRQLDALTGSDGGKG